MVPNTHLETLVIGIPASYPQGSTPRPGPRLRARLGMEKGRGAEIIIRATEAYRLVLASK